MSALSRDARTVIRDRGANVRDYVKQWAPDGQWVGDRCGCPDDRCIGHHHDEHDECGCLRSLVDDLFAGALP